jgi:hypothetical protein
MRRLTLLLSLVVGVVVAVGVSGAASPLGAMEAGWVIGGPVVRAAAPLPRVTMVTDSVGGVFFWATGPRDAFAKGFDLDLEVKTCRKLATPGCPAYGDPHPASALDTIRALGDQIGSIVVIDVGYNDIGATYGTDLDEVMSAMRHAGVSRVIWVTLEDMQSAWAAINEQIRAAQQRWAELTVADWAPVVSGQPWFADSPHMNYDGAVAFAAFLRPYVLTACGGPCAPPPPRFCGLAWTVRGFVPVQLVAGDSCAAALAGVVAIERGRGSDWQCAAVVDEADELDCRNGDAELQELGQPPVPATRHGALVILANWSFRLFGGSLQGRSGVGPWHVLARRSPFCVPAAPLEVLVALRLRRTTTIGGCFAPSG